MEKTVAESIFGFNLKTKILKVNILIYKDSKVNP